MLEHLQATLRQIEALNTYVYEHQVRRFQHDILTTGTFKLVSPFSGHALECAEARLIAFINDPYHFKLPLYAYRFADAADIWVMSFQIGVGFPLCALFIEDVCAINVQDAQAGPNRFKVLKRLTQDFEAIHATSYQSAGLTQPLAVLGHPNFAHHMWNELPALNALRREQPVETRTLFAPLGPLEGVAAAAPFSCLQQVGAPYFSPIGGEFLDQKTSDALTASMPAPARPASRPGSPLIWVAHREDGRSCDNFLEFLTAFDRQARTVCTPRYIFDSFSAPSDLEQSWYDPVRPAFEARQSQSDELYKRMRRAVSDPGSVMATTSGLTVMEAMAMARQADYYVTPIGSIQHKVAWLQSIPGLVHGPHSAMNHHVANWHGAKSEIARAPAILPAELVQNTRASAHHPRAERNMDYRITDPEAAAAFTIAHMRDVLSL